MVTKVGIYGCQHSCGDAGRHVISVNAGNVHLMKNNTSKTEKGVIHSDRMKIYITSFVYISYYYICSNASKCILYDIYRG